MSCRPQQRTPQGRREIRLNLMIIQFNTFRVKCMAVLESLSALRKITILIRHSLWSQSRRRIQIYPSDWRLDILITGAMYECVRNMSPGRCSAKYKTLQWVSTNRVCIFSELCFQQSSVNRVTLCQVVCLPRVTRPSSPHKQQGI